MRSIRYAVLILALATASVANAAQQCKPVVGMFEAQVQPPATCPGPLCTAGSVLGGIQGNYKFTMDKILPNGEPEVPTIFFFTGHSVITLKSGDQVFGTDTAPSTCLRGRAVSRR